MRLLDACLTDFLCGHKYIAISTALEYLRFAKELEAVDPPAEAQFAHANQKGSGTTRMRSDTRIYMQSIAIDLKKSANTSKMIIKLKKWLKNTRLT